MTGLRERMRGYLAADPKDVVPVRTRTLCTVIMIVLATFMSLAESAFTYNHMDAAGRGILSFWAGLSMMISFALPWILLIKRDRLPYMTCLLTSLSTLVLAIDPLMALMGLTGLIARRRRVDRLVPCATGTLVATLVSLTRDLNRPRKDSIIRTLLTEGADAGLNTPLAVVVLSLVFLVLSIAVGIYIRLYTTTQEATEQASAANVRSSKLENSLTRQQVTDTIAVETHDTLAHSLSLIGLNASALKVELDTLARQEQASSPQDPLTARLLCLAQRADDIRQQAAGALDETHSVIDMLRHPEKVLNDIAPDPQTALTREALDDICRESRDTGMTLNTWIDVRNLSNLDPVIGKVAFRAIQEGLTNARRHAPGMPVSLEVTARPDQGVHVHLTNPMPKPGTVDPSGANLSATSGGNGIMGLIKRVKAASGQCRYGIDDHGQFNLDVVLPFEATS